jgi:hypothetical protein
MPWKRAYPTEKVRALNGAIMLGFNATISERDLAGQIQASSSYRDLGRRLKELYALSADLDDVIRMCESKLT